VRSRTRLQSGPCCSLAAPSTAWTAVGADEGARCTARRCALRWSTAGASRGALVAEEDAVSFINLQREILEDFADAQGRAPRGWEYEDPSLRKRSHFNLNDGMSPAERTERVEQQIVVMREEWRGSHLRSSHRCAGCGIPIARRPRARSDARCLICMIEDLREVSRSRCRAHGAGHRGRYHTTLAKTLAQATRRAEAKRQREANRKADRKSAGLCQQCGKVPATSRCDDCKAKRQSRKAHAYP
jgi:hypothetical protein